MSDSDKDDDSSFELEEEEASDEDDVSNLADDPGPNRKVPSSSVARAPRRRDHDDSSNDEKELPSYMRKTHRGGYSHTAKSRQKIGDANRGNTPWNKGKNRSEVAKQRIGAGVRARNERILMANLKEIGLSLEEYNKVKLELKYMRERVRKARIAEKGHLERKEAEKEKLRKIQQSSEKMMKEEEASKPPDPIFVEKIVYETESSSGEEDGGVAQPASSPSEKPGPIFPDKEFNIGTGANPILSFQEGQQSPSSRSVLDQIGHAAKGTPFTEANSAIMAQEANGVQLLEASQESSHEPQQTAAGNKEQPSSAANVDKSHQVQHVPSVLRKDISWNNSDFDDEENEKYSDYCPIGGPGGLICCSACTSMYSDFLSETQKSLEDQKTIHIGWQVEAMSFILDETKDRLKKSLHAARLQPPPLMAAKGKVKDTAVVVPLGAVQDDGVEATADPKDPPGDSATAFHKNSFTKSDPPGKKRKADDTMNDTSVSEVKRGKTAT